MSASPRALTATRRERVEQILAKAFLTAFLVTADRERAENAVLHAIDRFDPATDPEEIIFEDAVLSAAQFPWTQREPDAPFLPARLQPVFHLPHELRRCFVLRILVGLSREICSALLHMSIGDVNTHTFAAILHLARLDA